MSQLSQVWVVQSLGLVRDLNSNLKLKKHFNFKSFVYKLMIGSFKNNWETYPRKCFRTQEKETQVKR